MQNAQNNYRASNKTELKNYEMHIHQSTIIHYLNLLPGLEAVIISSEASEEKNIFIQFLTNEIQKNWKSLTSYPTFTIEKQFEFIAENNSLIKILHISLANSTDSDL